MICRITLSFILCFLYLYGQSQGVNSDIKVNRKNVPKNNSVDYVSVEYFPLYEWEILNDTIFERDVQNQFDTLAMRYFSYYLFESKEPLLSNGQYKYETYRFVWSRAFHNTIIVRAEKRNKTYKIFWNVINDINSYYSEKRITFKKSDLKYQEWLKLKELIEAVRLGEMKFTRPDIGPEDGSDLLLESLNEKGYNAASLNSPKKGDFFNACMYLVDLTDLNIMKKDKY